jgi:hypothetical protein
MQQCLPDDFVDCLRAGAAHLGNGLELLGWPNACTDAPCHEVNALFSIWYFLARLNPPFHVYAEAPMADRGRVDLIGFNTKWAFAMEAKGFGAINAKATEVLRDFNRLKRFSPSLSELAGNDKARDWWRNAESRWGIVVVSSFRGVEVKEAWIAEDDDAVRAALATYRPKDQSRSLDGEAVGFLALNQALRDAQRGAFPIIEGARWNAGDGWLLWAAVPLPPTPESGD